MNSYTNDSFYENMSHQTDAPPYSVHYTEAAVDHEPVIYLHWHHEMEFLVLVQGEITVHMEDRSYVLQAGDGIFIPPGLLHYANSRSEIPPAFYAFVLSPMFLFPESETYSYNTYVLPVLHNNLAFATVLTEGIDWQKEILTYLNQIIQNQEAGELYMRGTSLLIWDKLFHHHISKIGGKKAFYVNADQLSDSLVYIHKNYHQNITLEELAEYAHLSEGQFCRSFKELTGMTPFRYLIRYRILQSCNQLLLTDKKVTEIALSCGFNNISYYNRAFFKIMRMTPTEYRKTTEKNSTFII